MTAVDLVKEAIQSIPYALTKVKLFQSDCGRKFDNALIDEMLVAFSITSSLSQAGCPYDNAVAETTYRLLQTGVYQTRNLPLSSRINP